MLSHTEIQYRLKEKLISSGIDESRVITEKVIHPPRKVGDGRVDVVWEFDDTEFSATGVAFEIKTRADKYVRRQALRQLHNSALCGYYPALVCKRSVYEDDSGSASSLEELTRAISASYVAYSEYPLSFQIENNNLPSDLTIPDCLNKGDDGEERS